MMDMHKFSQAENTFRKCLSIFEVEKGFASANTNAGKRGSDVSTSFLLNPYNSICD